jgi:hypothetical protein
LPAIAALALLVMVVVVAKPPQPKGAIAAKEKAKVASLGKVTKSCSKAKGS